MPRTTAADTVPEQLVDDIDHMQLTRLVTEVAWRIDHGKADTVHELFVDDGVSMPSSA
jgi:hypothetical protein